MSVGNGKRVSVGTVELEVGAVVVHAGGSVVVGAEQVGWGGLYFSGLFRLVSWQCQWAAGRVRLSLNLPLLAGGLLTLHGVVARGLYPWLLNCLVTELLQLKFHRLHRMN